MWMRSFFGGSDRRRYSTIVVAAVCVAAVAFGLATTSNASLSAASGQYKPGLFIKSATLSNNGNQVTVNGTASCSPAASGDLSISVVQGDNSAYSGLPFPAATCDIKTTKFSGTASTANGPSPSGPLSKGPATVNVNHASLSTTVTIDLK